MRSHKPLMARTPTDATRFTATGPYISAKPASGTSNFSPNPVSNTNITASTSGSFAGETPQQKITRLRAAAAQARRGKESTLDVAVRVGRVWADRMHRATALSLIGLTCVSAVVATFGITDMLVHNRRKRNEWLAEQQEKSRVALIEAREALKAGTVSEDQMLLINRARAAEEAEQGKKASKGVLRRAREWAFGGLSAEEEKGGRIGGLAREALGGREMGPEDGEEVLRPREEMGVVEAVQGKVDERRRQGERIEEVLRPLGGPLDREASALVERSKSWTGWVTGR